MFSPPPTPTAIPTSRKLNKSITAKRAAKQRPPSEEQQEIKSQSQKRKQKQRKQRNLKPLILWLQ